METDVRCACGNDRCDSSVDRQKMIIFGAALHGNYQSRGKTAVGVAYDPVTDIWRSLPESNLSPNASTAAWNGAEMIAWDYLNNTAAYDPRSDSWRSLPTVPLDNYECTPESVALGDRVVRQLLWFGRPVRAGQRYMEGRIAARSCRLGFHPRRSRPGSAASRQQRGYAEGCICRLPA